MDQRIEQCFVSCSSVTPGVCLVWKMQEITHDYVILYVAAFPLIFFFSLDPSLDVYSSVYSVICFLVAV